MTPEADVEIDVDVVRALLREQHPDLAHLPLAVAATGWDNVAVRIGDELVARLPRRAVAVVLLENEQRWLPVLAPLLPVDVPAPLRLGRPGPAFERPWTVTRWIDGVRAADRPRSSRTAWAEHLAQVVAALHQPAPAEAPHNPVRAVPLAERTASVMPRLSDANGLAWASALWRRGCDAAPWPGAPTWVHGDPHPGNVLVRGGGEGTADRLAALLDFGDLSAGDPACDLAAAWLHFDVVGRAAFVTAYDRLRPGPDPGRWDRAAAWALAVATSVTVLAGDDETNAAWARGALTELSREDL